MERNKDGGKEVERSNEGGKEVERNKEGRRKEGRQAQGVILARDNETEVCLREICLRRHGKRNEEEVDD
ncbi:hypothetical protein Pmani_023701 [Petrolisthes manimaculis]|uniref:Uncharacterized protein n=1 Tax=Petrolisthes manimaculis TaxID=1843537 RepID=A0AAE1PA54_9EUCA|nr:hypothetical protein Pmani_023701 [Petrolisthes manimaculis]